MVLSAAEKLKILATGKATLKEINELEKQAEGEKTNENETQTTESVVERKEEVVEHAEKTSNESGEPEKNESPVSSSVEEDERDKKIAELEAQIKEMQKDNVNEDNSGDVIDTDTALLNIFKDFK
jgi:hypothetical protein